MDIEDSHEKKMLNDMENYNEFQFFKLLFSDEILEMLSQESNKLLQKNAYR